jgi:hypothetical protein
MGFAVVVERSGTRALAITGGQEGVDIPPSNRFTTGVWR